MEQAIECFLAVSLAVIGISHLLRAEDWAAAFGRMHHAGRVGAFVNGGLSLLPGAIILAGYRVWSFPGVVITVFGVRLTVKGAICFLAPEKALRSMEHGANSPTSFKWAGGVALAIGSWAAWCVWRAST